MEKTKKASLSSMPEILNNTETPKVVIISFFSKEIEGRVHKFFDHFNRCEGFSCYLIQACRSDIEKSSENNVINIELPARSNSEKFVYFVDKTRKILNSKSFDYFILENYYCAIFSKWIDSKRIIYDAYELYYPGCGRKFSFRDYVFYKLEKDCICKAGYILAANQERALVMTGRYKLKAIPDVVTNSSNNLCKGGIPSHKEFAIVYAGYLSEERNIIKLIEAVKKYNAISEKKLKLCIYGYGTAEDEIKELSNVDEYIQFLGPYRNKDINSFLGKYMYGYVAYPNDEINTILCSPNKLSDYANNRVVIIGNENYNLKKTVNKWKIGCCSDDILMAIQNVVKNYQEYLENEEKYIDSAFDTNEFLGVEEYIKVKAFI